MNADEHRWQSRQAISYPRLSAFISGSLSSTPLSEP